jgi:hypothetical protein
MTVFKVVISIVALILLLYLDRKLHNNEKHRAKKRAFNNAMADFWLEVHRKVFNVFKRR